MLQKDSLPYRTIRLNADMLLMLDYGIFYEFIPVDQLEKQIPKHLQSVRLKRT